GPAINFLFAIVIMAGLFMVKGQPYTPAIAASIVEGSAAEAAGLQPDDKIIEVNGEKVKKFQDVVAMVSVNLGAEMEIKVLRAVEVGKWADQPITYKITPRVIVEEDRFGFRHTVGRIGVVSPPSAQ